MKNILVRIAAVLVVSVPLCMSSPAGAQPIDVTGKWLFTVESGGGTGMPTVTFKQEGEKLTGHYSSQLLGEVDLTGSIKGQTISFLLNADIQGTKVAVTYTGTVEGKDSMKGTMSAGELGGGTFTGKRQ